MFSNKYLKNKDNFVELLDNTKAFYDASGFAVALIPIAILGIYLKHTYLSQNTGYLLLSRITSKLSVNELTLVERLGLFQADILIFCFLLPTIGFVLALFMKGLLRVIVFLMLELVLIILFYANLQSLGNVGGLLSVNLLIDSIQWGINHPRSIREYIEISGVVKITLVMLSAVTITLYAAEISKKFPFNNLFNKLRLPILIICVSTATVILLITWYSTERYFPQHNPILPSVLTRFLNMDNSYEKYKYYTNEEKLSTYKLLSKTDNNRFSSLDSKYFGKEKESNLIIFVMETAPRKLFDLNGGVETLVNLNSLVEKSFVGLKHFTTHPYTSNAVFSIMSSVYPDARRNINEVRLWSGYDTGLFSNLKKNNYFTASYSPYKSIFASDEVMYEQLGIDYQYISELADSIPQHIIEQLRNDLKDIKANPALADNLESDVSQVMLYDLAALDMLKQNIANVKKRDQKFAMIYFPQIGHGPWVDLRGSSNITERGRAIIELQDKWLGSLLEFLIKESLEDETVIVVTSDHGIRTKREDIDFMPGFIDEYSFNVPLYIYAPNTLRDSLYVDWVTSHIDISPTILSLFGVKDLSEWNQGLSIWNTALLHRRTFFFAGDYLGADGYHEKGRYFMNSIFNNSSYMNTSLSFKNVGSGVTRDIESDFVQESINNIRGLTKHWGGSR